MGLYWVGLTVGALAIDIISWVLAAGGLIVGGIGVWVDRRSKDALAIALGRPRRQVRRVPRRNLRAFDAWLALHPTADPENHHS